MTPGGGELILREEFLNPDEHQLCPFQSHEVHPAKADARVTARVVCEDDLVGRQRNAEAVGEEHKRTGWTVSDNSKIRDPVGLPDDRRGRHEVDEQRNVVHRILHVASCLPVYKLVDRRFGGLAFRDGCPVAWSRQREEQLPCRSGWRVRQL